MKWKENMAYMRRTQESDVAERAYVEKMRGARAEKEERQRIRVAEMQEKEARLEAIRAKNELRSLKWLERFGSDLDDIVAAVARSEQYECKIWIKVFDLNAKELISKNCFDLVTMIVEDGSSLQPNKTGQVKIADFCLAHVIYERIKTVFDGIDVSTSTDSTD